MTSQPSPEQPPRIASWLLSLFAPSDQSESILGDLSEEFSILADQPGSAVARRWYWRQTLKTIVHLNGNAFRTAPARMFLTIFGALWCLGFATRWSAHIMQRFLDAQRLYESHPDAYLFWLTFPLLLGRVVLCTVIGAVIALLARRREMPTVIAFASVQMILFIIGTATLIFNRLHWLPWFDDMLPWNLLCAVATVMGGMLVKLWRPKPAASAVSILPQ